MSLRLLVALAALAVPAGSIAGVTAEDCARWIDQLGGEVTRAEITGDDAADSRNAILHEIEGARRAVGESVDASNKRVQRVQRQAAQLVAQGRVSQTQGERLSTLVEATRRCLEQAKSR